MADLNGAHRDEEHDDREAEFLERYWEALEHDLEASPPRGLSAELATLSRRLHLDAAADEPAPEALARIAARIEAGRVQHASPASTPRAVRWRRWLPRTVAAGFAAVLLVVVLVLGGVMQDHEDGGSLGAAEILRAARAAAGLSDEVPLDRTKLESIADAQELATFVVRTPIGIPEPFAVEAIIHQRWPHAGEGVHADFVLLTYRTPEGGWLEIWQGFTAPYLSFQPLAPEGHSGLLAVQGKEAVWIAGRPLDHGGTWDPVSQTALGILEAYHHGSPRFTVLASNVLTLEELAAIAESLQ